jgi:hypothetical protein
VVSPGDFNADGEVDAADYVVWRQSHGSSTDLRADGNGDGSIDDADYAVWRAHFGTTYGGAMLGIIALPEPSSALTLFVWTCAVCHCSRWRKGP